MKKKKNILMKNRVWPQDSVHQAIEIISKSFPQLIGGSADLSGSNNTKTNNSKVINSKILMEIIFITVLENMEWLQ